MMGDAGGSVRLYLVRHGETAQNVEMRYLGLGDEPLNERGRNQARLLGEAFERIPLRRVVSSPMRRAGDTAAAIGAGTGVEVRSDPRLAEGSFGSWEGLTRGEVRDLGPEDAALLERWEADASAAPPGGESILGVQRRVVGLADELAGEFPGGAVALVSHVGPIKALVAAVLGVPLPVSRRLFLDPGTITVLEWGPRPLLRLFNSHAHLGWTSARWMR
ncbi:MAG: histidine phosphatase family protein [Acidobacteria bacterium]|nr:histidine phosphatase family protein [Acidobacteriota bacterium]